MFSLPARARILGLFFEVFRAGVLLFALRQVSRLCLPSRRALMTCFRMIMVRRCVSLRRVNIEVHS